MENAAKFTPLFNHANVKAGHVLRPVARAVAVLRSGDVVILKSANPEGGALLVASAESGWRDHAFTRVVMSAPRARVLGLDLPEQPTRAVVMPWKAGADSGSLALSPTGKLPDELQGAELSPAGDMEQAALQLLKYAFMLPVGLLASLSADEAENFTAEYGVVSVEADVIADYPEASALNLVLTGEANVPLKQAQNARIMVFRQPHGLEEHLAILVGEPNKAGEPLVRIHSSCLTGDVLGSLRCDCGDQLQAALEAISKAGSGVVLYLNQEGRGIGLSNKLKAYALQEAGMDTVDANEALGFDADERDFTAAASILQQLGLERIRLLTNNPRKVQAVEEQGIAVVERVGLVTTPNPHNESYLKTKETRCGHLL